MILLCASALATACSGALESDAHTLSVQTVDAWRTRPMRSFDDSAIDGDDQSFADVDIDEPQVEVDVESIEIDPSVFQSLSPVSLDLGAVEYNDDVDDRADGPEWQSDIDASQSTDVIDDEIDSDIDSSAVANALAEGHKTDERFLVSNADSSQPPSAKQLQSAIDSILPKLPKNAIGTWLKVSVFVPFSSSLQQSSAIDRWQMRWTLSHLQGDIAENQLGVAAAPGKGRNQPTPQSAKRQCAQALSVAQFKAKSDPTPIRTVLANALANLPQSFYANPAVAQLTCHHMWEDIKSNDLGKNTRQM